MWAGQMCQLVHGPRTTDLRRWHWSMEEAKRLFSDGTGRRIPGRDSRVSEVYQTKKTGSSFEVSMLEGHLQALVKMSNLLAMFMVQQVYVEVFFCIFESVLLIFLKHPMTSFEERVSVGLLSGDITPTNRPRIYEIRPNGDDTSSS